MKATNKLIVLISVLTCMLTAALGISAMAETYADGNITYEITGSNAVVTGYKGGDDKLTIPKTVTYNKKNYTVNAIGAGKCIFTEKSIKSLKTLELPDSVKTIGASAFEGSALVTVKAPAVSSIGDKAFNGCVKLTMFNYDSGKNVIPATCTSLGVNAFTNTALTGEITIACNLKAVPTSAFLGCKSVTKVTMANGVETIAATAFSTMNHLAEVVIPTSIKSIDATAFNGSLSSTTKLTVVTNSVAASIIKGNASLKPNANYIGTETHVASLTTTPSGSLATWVGKTEYIALNAAPVNTTDIISWDSFSQDVASISFSSPSYAKVDPLKTGTTDIVACADDLNDNEIKKAVCHVTVYAAPTSLKITDTDRKGKTTTKLEMSKLSDIKLSAAAAPDKTHVPPVTWSSSDSSVASVTVDSTNSTKCTVKILKEGKATITAKVYNGVKATYVVEGYVKRGELNDSSIKKYYQVAIGKSGKISSKNLKNYKVLNSNSAVATFKSATGKYTGKKAGYTELKFYTTDKQQIAYVVVKPAKQQITKATVTGKQVRLVWKKQAGVTGYQVWYKAADGGKYKKINTKRDQAHNTYIFETLKENTTYKFKVRSYVQAPGKTVYGAYSAVKTVTTKAADKK